jgi:hypothetical protein
MTWQNREFMLNVSAKLLYTEFDTDSACTPINSSTYISTNLLNHLFNVSTSLNKRLIKVYVYQTCNALNATFFWVWQYDTMAFNFH